MLASIIERLLNRYFEPYFTGISQENLRVGIWDGDLVLENLKLKPAIADEFGLPFSIVDGSCKKIHVSIPWSSLGKRPIVLVIESVTIFLKTKEYTEYSDEEVLNFLRDAKMQQIKLLESEYELLANQSKAEGDAARRNERQSLFFKLTKSMFDNIQIDIRDVHVYFEDEIHQFKLGFCLGSGYIRNAADSYEEAQKFASWNSPHLGKTAASSSNAASSSSHVTCKACELKDLMIYSYTGDFLEFDDENVFELLTYKLNHLNEEEKLEYLRKKSREKGGNLKTSFSRGDSSSASSSHQEESQERVRGKAQHNRQGDDVGGITGDASSVCNFILKPLQVRLTVFHDTNNRSLSANLQLSEEHQGFELTFHHLKVLLKLIREMNSTKRKNMCLLQRDAHTVNTSLEDLESITQEEFVSLHGREVSSKLGVPEIKPLSPLEIRRLQVLHDVVDVRHLAHWRYICLESANRILDETASRRRPVTNNVKGGTWWKWITGGYDENQAESDASIVEDDDEKKEDSFVTYDEMRQIIEAVQSDEAFQSLTIPRKYGLKFTLRHFSFVLLDEEQAAFSIRGVSLVERMKPIMSSTNMADDAVESAVTAIEVFDTSASFSVLSKVDCFNIDNFEWQFSFNLTNFSIKNRGKVVMTFHESVGVPKYILPTHGNPGSLVRHTAVAAEQIELFYGVETYGNVFGLTLNLRPVYLRLDAASIEGLAVFFSRHDIFEDMLDASSPEEFKREQLSRLHQRPGESSFFAASSVTSSSSSSSSVASSSSTSTSLSSSSSYSVYAKSSSSTHIAAPVQAEGGGLLPHTVVRSSCYAQNEAEDGIVGAQGFEAFNEDGGALLLPSSQTRSPQHNHIGVGFTSPVFPSNRMMLSSTHYIPGPLHSSLHPSLLSRVYNSLTTLNQESSEDLSGSGSLSAGECESSNVKTIVSMDGQGSNTNADSSVSCNSSSISDALNPSASTSTPPNRVIEDARNRSGANSTLPPSSQAEKAALTRFSESRIQTSTPVPTPTHPPNPSPTHTHLLEATTASASRQTPTSYVYLKISIDSPTIYFEMPDDEAPGKQRSIELKLGTFSLYTNGRCPKNRIIFSVTLEGTRVCCLMGDSREECFLRPLPIYSTVKIINLSEVEISLILKQTFFEIRKESFGMIILFLKAVRDAWNIWINSGKPLAAMNEDAAGSQGLSLVNRGGNMGRNTVSPRLGGRIYDEMSRHKGRGEQESWRALGNHRLEELRRAHGRGGSGVASASDSPHLSRVFGSFNDTQRNEEEFKLPLPASPPSQGSIDRSRWLDAQHTQSSSPALQPELEEGLTTGKEGGRFIDGGVCAGQSVIHSVFPEDKLSPGRLKKLVASSSSLEASSESGLSADAYLRRSRLGQFGVEDHEPLEASNVLLPDYNLPLSTSQMYNRGVLKDEEAIVRPAATCCTTSGNSSSVCGLLSAPSSRTHGEKLQCAGKESLFASSVRSLSSSSFDAQKSIPGDSAFHHATSSSLNMEGVSSSECDSNSPHDQQKLSDPRWVYQRPYHEAENASFPADSDRVQLQGNPYFSPAKDTIFSSQGGQSIGAYPIGSGGGDSKETRAEDELLRVRSSEIPAKRGRRGVETEDYGEEEVKSDEDALLDFFDASSSLETDFLRSEATKGIGGAPHSTEDSLKNDANALASSAASMSTLPAPNNPKCVYVQEVNSLDEEENIRMTVSSENALKESAYNDEMKPSRGGNLLLPSSLPSSTLIGVKPPRTFTLNACFAMQVFGLTVYDAETSQERIFVCEASGMQVNYTLKGSSASTMETILESFQVYDQTARTPLFYTLHDMEGLGSDDAQQTFNEEGREAAGNLRNTRKNIQNSFKLSYSRSNDGPSRICLITAPVELNWHPSSVVKILQGFKDYMHLLKAMNPESSIALESSKNSVTKLSEAANMRFSDEEEGKKGVHKTLDDLSKSKLKKQLRENLLESASWKEFLSRKAYFGAEFLDSLKLHNIRVEKGEEGSSNELKFEAKGGVDFPKLEASEVDGSSVCLLSIHIQGAAATFWKGNEVFCCLRLHDARLNGKTQPDEVSVSYLLSSGSLVIKDRCVLSPPPSSSHDQKALSKPTASSSSESSSDLAGSSHSLLSGRLLYKTKSRPNKELYIQSRLTQVLYLFFMKDLSELLSYFDDEILNAVISRSYTAVRGVTSSNHFYMDLVVIRPTFYLAEDKEVVKAYLRKTSSESSRDAEAKASTKGGTDEEATQKHRIQRKLENVKAESVKIAASRSVFSGKLFKDSSVGVMQSAFEQSSDSIRRAAVVDERKAATHEGVVQLRSPDGDVATEEDDLVSPSSSCNEEHIKDSGEDLTDKESDYCKFHSFDEAEQQGSGSAVSLSQGAPRDSNELKTSVPATSSSSSFGNEVSAVFFDSLQNSSKPYEDAWKLKLGKLSNFSSKEWLNKRRYVEVDNIDSYIILDLGHLQAEVHSFSQEVCDNGILGLNEQISDEFGFLELEDEEDDVTGCKLAEDANLEFKEAAGSEEFGDLKMNGRGYERKNVSRSINTLTRGNRATGIVEQSIREIENQVNFVSSVKILGMTIDIVETATGSKDIAGSVLNNFDASLFIDTDDETEVTLRTTIWFMRLSKSQLTFFLDVINENLTGRGYDPSTVQLTLLGSEKVMGNRSNTSLSGSVIAGEIQELIESTSRTVRFHAVVPEVYLEISDPVDCPLATFRMFQFVVDTNACIFDLYMTYEALISVEAFSIDYTHTQAVTYYKRLAECCEYGTSSKPSLGEDDLNDGFGDKLQFSASHLSHTGRSGNARAQGFPIEGFPVIIPSFEDIPQSSVCCSVPGITIRIRSSLHETDVSLSLENVAIYLLISEAIEVLRWGGAAWGDSTFSKYPKPTPDVEFTEAAAANIAGGGAASSLSGAGGRANAVSGNSNRFSNYPSASLNTQEGSQVTSSGLAFKKTKLGLEAFDSIPTPTEDKGFASTHDWRSSPGHPQYLKAADEGVRGVLGKSTSYSTYGVDSTTGGGESTAGPPASFKLSYTSPATSSMEKGGFLADHEDAIDSKMRVVPELPEVKDFHLSIIARSCQFLAYSNPTCATGAIVMFSSDLEFKYGYDADVLVFERMLLSNCKISRLDISKNPKAHSDRVNAAMLSLIPTQSNGGKVSRALQASVSDSNRFTAEPASSSNPRRDENAGNASNELLLASPRLLQEGDSLPNAFLSIHTHTAPLQTNEGRGGLSSINKQAGSLTDAEISSLLPHFIVKSQVTLCDTFSVRGEGSWKNSPVVPVEGGAKSFELQEKEAAPDGLQKALNKLKIPSQPAGVFLGIGDDDSVEISMKLTIADFYISLSTRDLGLLIAAARSLYPRESSEAPESKTSPPPPSSSSSKPLPNAQYPRILIRIAVQGMTCTFMDDFRATVIPLLKWKMSIASLETYVSSTTIEYWLKEAENEVCVLNNQKGVWEPLLERSTMSILIEMTEKDRELAIVSSQPILINLTPELCKLLVWFIPYLIKNLNDQGGIQSPSSSEGEEGVGRDVSSSVVEARESAIDLVKKRKDSGVGGAIATSTSSVACVCPPLPANLPSNATSSSGLVGSSSTMMAAATPSTRESLFSGDSILPKGVLLPPSLSTRGGGAGNDAENANSAHSLSSASRFSSERKSVYPVDNTSLFLTAGDFGHSQSSRWRSHGGSSDSHTSDSHTVFREDKSYPFELDSYVSHASSKARGKGARNFFRYVPREEAVEVTSMDYSFPNADGVVTEEKRLLYEGEGSRSKKYVQHPTGRGGSGMGSAFNEVLTGTSSDPSSMRGNGGLIARTHNDARNHSRPGGAESLLSSSNPPDFLTGIASEDMTEMTSPRRVSGGGVHTPEVGNARTLSFKPPTLSLRVSSGINAYMSPLSGYWDPLGATPNITGKKIDAAPDVSDTHAGLSSSASSDLHAGRDAGGESNVSRGAPIAAGDSHTYLSSSCGNLSHSDLQSSALFGFAGESTHSNALPRSEASSLAFVSSPASGEAITASTITASFSSIAKSTLNPALDMQSVHRRDNTESTHMPPYSSSTSSTESLTKRERGEKNLMRTPYDADASLSSTHLHIENLESSKSIIPATHTDSNDTSTSEEAAAQNKCTDARNHSALDFLSIRPKEGFPPSASAAAASSSPFPPPPTPTPSSNIPGSLTKRGSSAMLNLPPPLPKSSSSEDRGFQETQALIASDFDDQVVNSSMLRCVNLSGFSFYAFTMVKKRRRKQQNQTDADSPSVRDASARSYRGIGAGAGPLPEKGDTADRVAPASSTIPKPLHRVSSLAGYYHHHHLLLRRGGNSSFDEQMWRRTPRISESPCSNGGVCSPIPEALTSDSTQQLQQAAAHTPANKLFEESRQSSMPVTLLEVEGAVSSKNSDHRGSIFAAHSEAGLTPSSPLNGPWERGTGTANSGNSPHALHAGKPRESSSSSVKMASFSKITPSSRLRSLDSLLQVGNSMDEVRRRLEQSSFLYLCYAPDYLQVEAVKKNFLSNLSDEAIIRQILVSRSVSQTVKDLRETFNSGLVAALAGNNHGGDAGELTCYREGSMHYFSNDSLMCPAVLGPLPATVRACALPITYDSCVKVSCNTDNLVEAQKPPQAHRTVEVKREQREFMATFDRTQKQNNEDSQGFTPLSFLSRDKSRVSEVIAEVISPHPSYKLLMISSTIRVFNKSGFPLELCFFNEALNLCEVSSIVHTTAPISLLSHNPGESSTSGAESSHLINSQTSVESGHTPRSMGSGSPGFAHAEEVHSEFPLLKHVNYQTLSKRLPLSPASASQGDLDEEGKVRVTSQKDEKETATASQRYTLGLPDQSFMSVPQCTFFGKNRCAFSFRPLAMATCFEKVNDANPSDGWTEMLDTFAHDREAHLVKTSCFRHKHIYFRVCIVKRVCHLPSEAAVKDVHIYPALTLFNCIPAELSVSLSVLDSTPKKSSFASTFSLLGNSSLQLYTVYPSYSLQIRVKLAALESSNWSERTTVSFDTNEQLTHRVCMSGRKYSMTEIEISQDSAMISQYVPFVDPRQLLVAFNAPRWFVDRTGIGIVPASADFPFPSLEDIYLLGPSRMTSMHLMLPRFLWNSIKGLERNFPGLFEADIPALGGFSEANIETPTGFYTFCLKTTRLKPSESLGLVTRLVCLYPQYIVTNYLTKRVFIRQNGSSALSCEVMAGASAPLEWCKKDSLLLFEFSSEASRLFWSSPVFPHEESVGNTWMIVRKEKRELSLYKVTVATDGGIRSVSISAVKDNTEGCVLVNRAPVVPSIRLLTFHDEPNSLSEDIVRQTSCPFSVPYGGSCHFGWVNPFLYPSRWCSLQVYNVKTRTFIDEFRSDLSSPSFRDTRVSIGSGASHCYVYIQKRGNSLLVEITPALSRASLQLSPLLPSGAAFRYNQAKKDDLAESEERVNFTVQIMFSQLGISFISELYRQEILFLELLQFMGEFAHVKETQKLQVSFADIQLDYQLDNSEIPVIIANRGAKREHQDDTLQDDLETSSATSNRLFVFSLERPHASSRDFIIKKFYLFLNELEFAIDTTVLNVLNDCFNEYMSALGWKANDGTSYAEITGWVGKPMHIYFTPPALPLVLVIQSFLIERCSIAVWCSFVMDKMHMLSDILRLGLQIIMASDKLELKGGFVTLSEACFQEVRVSAPLLWLTLKDLYIHSALTSMMSLVGSSSLLNIPRIPLHIGRNTIGYAAHAVGAMSAGIGTFLSTFTFDAKYINQRQKERGKNKANIRDGLISAGKNISEGVVALTNVVTEPLAGAKEEGVGGFFRGIGKGLVGSLIKPLDKVGQAFTDVSDGIRAGVSRSVSMQKFRVTRRRKPRLLWGDLDELRAYRPEDAELRELLGSDFSKDLRNSVSLFRQRAGSEYEYVLFYPRIIRAVDLAPKISKESRGSSSSENIPRILWETRINQISGLEATSHGILIFSSTPEQGRPDLKKTSYMQIETKSPLLMVKIYKEIEVARSLLNSTIEVSSAAELRLLEE